MFDRLSGDFERTFEVFFTWMSKNKAFSIIWGTQLLRTKLWWFGRRGADQGVLIRYLGKWMTFRKSLGLDFRGGVRWGELSVHWGVGASIADSHVDSYSCFWEGFGGALGRVSGGFWRGFGRILGRFGDLRTASWFLFCRNGDFVKSIDFPQENCSFSGFEPRQNEFELFKTDEKSKHHCVERKGWENASRNVDFLAGPGALGPPKNRQKLKVLALGRSKKSPKIVQDTQKIGFGTLFGRVCISRWAWGRFWEGFGTIFGGFWRWRTTWLTLILFTATM